MFKETKEGQTHYCCQKRLKEQGKEAFCCHCVPYDDCLENKFCKKCISELKRSGTCPIDCKCQDIDEEFVKWFDSKVLQ